MKVDGGGRGSAGSSTGWMNEDLNLQRSSHTPKPPRPARFRSPLLTRRLCKSPAALSRSCIALQRGTSAMPAMSTSHDPVCVPYLQVYKDGQLVDGACLQGRDRWIAGRHADCDIFVGHASTSRRHLQIQVLQATQELLLVDLNSAHGTRVNGEALTSASPYKAKQDDTVQMGASTRSYKVDWVPVVTAMAQPARAAAMSAVEHPSSPNYASNASFRHNVGNLQGAKNSIKNESSSKGMSKGALSPTRAQGPRGGRTELPPRSTPARRVPFANVQASALNVRSPQGRHSLRKATTLPEKLAHPKVVAVVEDRRAISNTTKEAQEDGVSPSFWLRRCSSAPRGTAGEDACTHDKKEAGIVSESSRKCSGEDSRSEIPVTSTSICDDYPSDKENWQPGNTRKSLSCDGRQSCSSLNVEEDRQPFAVLQADLKWLKPSFSSSLASSSDSDMRDRSRALGLPPPQRPATSALVNNLDYLFGKLKLSGELRCQWHVVVDTNCFLDTDALKSLKQLEGIRETRIIVPKIVLRELDGLKRRSDIGHSARVALKWMEDCMERIPFWMHVQSLTETLPVQRIPPSSSSRIRSFSGHSDKGIMAPTNDDHILDCALLFDRSETDGRVVLLTRDTALRIKARAEGLTVENAALFCQSLLSPYSERFLWLGSIAYRSPPVKSLASTLLPFTSYDDTYAAADAAAALSTLPFSTSNLEMRSASKLSPEEKGHWKQGVAEFQCHYSEQPQGLQVVLA